MTKGQSSPKKRGRPLRPTPKDKPITLVRPGRGRKKVPFQKYIDESESHIKRWKAEISCTNLPSVTIQSIKNKIAALKSRIQSRKLHEEMHAKLGKDEFDTVFAVVQNAVATAT